EAERKFKEVSEANEVLSDPDKRKLYDQLGSNWQAYQHSGDDGPGSAPGANPFAGFGGSSPGGGVRYEFRGNSEDLEGFSDFFRTFFGGGVGSQTGGGATQTRVRTGASIEDLLAGLGADGPGKASNGRRQVAPQRLEAQAEMTLEEVDAGTKRLLEVNGRRLEVNIPAGVRDGQKIRFSGVADGADAYITVRVKPHAAFTRAGSDLRSELPISLREALLGGEVPVRTLHGRVLLRIPPETQNGRSFRLAGKGLPHFAKDGRGDLYVKVTVVLPTGLSDEAQAIAQQFLSAADQEDPRA
ncbi:MAG TPA: DnaJ C-terminal domain-containing protein, partial [Candidatus Limnocylindrales bacterium]|nr:DnaJ C-terminal domain-containing protein [Candidatus Limnocylindrales bacterium]